MVERLAVPWIRDPRGGWCWLEVYVLGKWKSWRGKQGLFKGRGESLNAGKLPGQRKKKKG